MSRGLSKQQLRILGLCAAVNRFTNGGDLKVKRGVRISADWRYDWVAMNSYRGPADINNSLAIHWLFEIPFCEQGYRHPVNRTQRLRDGYVFTDTYDMYTMPYYLDPRHPKKKSAKASVSRMFRSLFSRGLLIFNRPAVYCGSSKCTSLWQACVLTDDGMALARDVEETPPDLADALSRSPIWNKSWLMHLRQGRRENRFGCYNRRPPRVDRASQPLWLKGELYHQEH